MTLRAKQIQHATEGTLLLVPELRDSRCDGCCFEPGLDRSTYVNGVCSQRNAVCDRRFREVSDPLIAIHNTPAAIEAYVVAATAAKLTGQLP